MGEAEFVTIKYSDLVRRLTKRNLIRENKAELCLWLMNKGGVYDTTHANIEFKWYWLTRGTGGRMADGEVMDYTQGLKDWNGLK